MAKLILEFDLSNQDDLVDSKTTLNAAAYSSVLCTIDERLRNDAKHNGYKKYNNIPDYIDSLRNMIREELANRGVAFE